MKPSANKGETEALPAGPELDAGRQTARMVVRPLAFMQELRERFGDVFTVRLRDEAPWVMVSDPTLIGEVLRAPATVLHGGEGKRILQPVVGDSSVLLLDEGRHLRQRKLLLPPFAGSRVRGYEEAMRAAAERIIERWPLESADAAMAWTRAIALESILHAVFGVGESERLDPLRESLAELRLPGTAREAQAPAFRRVRARVDELIFAEIAARAGSAKAEETVGDVLSLLLRARHEDGSTLSKTEIRDELMSLLMAGHETTATTLAWALERLAHSPAALGRAEREADSGGGPYTEAVIKETLRLRPALPFVARAVKATFDLGGREIPPGVTIVPAILLLHHRPDIYANPASFRPERFLGREPDPHTWIPFGGGRRRCIGAHFALLEMRVVLSTLLARRSVRPAEPDAEAMRRRDVTLSPSRGARLVLTPRRNRQGRG